MKRWQLQTEPDDRGRAARDRARRPGRPHVESLEARALLATVHAAVMPGPAVHKMPEPKVKFPPYNISAEIDPISDPAGSGNVFRQEILVDGHAPAFSTLWLAVGTKPGYFTNVTRADGTGYYVFALPVNYGSSLLRVFAETPGQDYSNVTTVNVSRGNAIVAWDAIALRAFLNQNTSPAEAARVLAILHAAQYDAVAAVDFPNAAYQVHVAAPRGASAEAAADSSAYTVLSGFFPSLKTTFFNAYAAAVAGLPATPSTTAGLDLGFQVGDQSLANRDNDNSNLAVGIIPSNVDGRWRPTPPSYVPAVDAQFGLVRPLEIASGSADRPAAPPAVGSTAYDQALMQVASLGRFNSTSRTPSETAAALFWSDPVGSGNSPGPWNLIAQQVSVSRKDTLDQDARLFAQLDFALADAAIASSDSQIAFDEWRPISAIQKLDPTYAPLVTTPASPAYVSDRAAYGAAAADVLSTAFGPKVKFKADINSATGATRTFSNFAAAAAEDASSQVWAGINFAFDAQAGVNLGTQVAQAVLTNFPGAK